MKFGFPRPAGHPRGQGDWRCPNCGGDCYGSALIPKPFRYYCQGNSLGTQTEQTPACGYWETHVEPRKHGVRR
jgi:hypothetical protein